MPVNKEYFFFRGKVEKNLSKTAIAEPHLLNQRPRAYALNVTGSFGLENFHTGDFRILCLS